MTGGGGWGGVDGGTGPDNSLYSRPSCSIFPVERVKTIL